MNKNRRRVVITGMGAVTPLGHSVASLYESQIHGRSGVERIRNFDARKFPTTFAAEVKDFELRKFLPDAERYQYSGVNTRFALAAAKQAIEDANAISGIDRTRFGVYLGNGEGQNEFDHLIAAVANAARPGEPRIEPTPVFDAAIPNFYPRREHGLEMHTSAGRRAARPELLRANFTLLN